MHVADVLAAYLVTQSLGTAGTDLFVDYLPDQPDNAIALYLVPGLGPEFTLAQGHPLDNERIQVFTRGAPGDYPTPRTKASAISAAFHSVLNTTLSGLRFLSMAQTDVPVLIGRDSKERCTFSQYWDLTVERT